MKLFLFLSSLAVFAVSAADAADCRRVSVLTPVSYVTPYIAPAIITQFVPLPTYSVSYAPPGGGDMKALIEQVQALTVQVNRLSKGGQPAPQPPQPNDNPPLSAVAPSSASFAVFTQKCAQCHDKGIAGQKGHGVVLTDAGSMADLSCETLLKMSIAVTTSRMPKGGKLSDSELDQAMSWIDAKAHEQVALK